MNRKLLAGWMIAAAVTAAPIALADPPGPLVECANHTHVWSADQCPDTSGHGPYGFPGGGGGGGGGGLLGVVHRLTGGLL